MNPIGFQCHHIIARTGSEICSEIADTAHWGGFTGYGILPGIESAEYEKRTDDMVGSRIRVRNTDGSQHVEEITKWVPGREVGMKLHEFSPPLSHLATHITEEWDFQAQDHATLVTRTFHIFPRRAATRPIVWLISLFFRRAIARHLAAMAAMARVANSRKSWQL